MHRLSVFAAASTYTASLTTTAVFRVFSHFHTGFITSDFLLGYVGFDSLFQLLADLAIAMMFQVRRSAFLPSTVREIFSVSYVYPG